MQPGFRLSCVAAMAAALASVAWGTCTVSPAATTIVSPPGPAGADGARAAIGTPAGRFYLLFAGVVEQWDAVTPLPGGYVIGGRAPPSGGNTYNFHTGPSHGVYQPATKTLFVVDGTDIVSVDVSDPQSATATLLMTSADVLATSHLSANTTHLFLTQGPCVRVIDPRAASPTAEPFVGRCGDTATTKMTAPSPAATALLPVTTIATSTADLVAFNAQQSLMTPTANPRVAPLGDLPPSIGPAGPDVARFFADGSLSFFGRSGCTVHTIGSQRPLPATSSATPTATTACTNSSRVIGVAGDGTGGTFYAVAVEGATATGLIFSGCGGVAGTPGGSTPTIPAPGIPTMEPQGSLPGSRPPTAPPAIVTTTGAPGVDGRGGGGDGDADVPVNTIIIASVVGGTVVILAIIVAVVILMRSQKAHRTANEPIDEPRVPSTEPATPHYAVQMRPTDSRGPTPASFIDSRSLPRSNMSTANRQAGYARTPTTASQSLNRATTGSTGGGGLSKSNKHDLGRSDNGSATVSVLSRSDFSRPADAVLGVRSWSNAELRRHNKRCQHVREGSYQKGKLLGRGANGSVYSIMLKDGSTIAMKEVNLMGSEDEIQAQMSEVEREMELLSQLHHDNLVTYYAVQCDRRNLQVSLFMENVTGGSLGAMVRSMDSPLAEETAQRFTKQMLRGLAVIHEQGIVHRDLKCDNVLRDAHTGTVKLADFGTARSVGHTVGASKAAQTMIGTPFFMAPEILASGMGLSGLSAADEEAEAGYGVKADIWSLGITVGELLNRGNPPWPAFPSPGHAFLHIANPESAPVVPEGLSEAGVSFYRACTQRNPRERPTARELLDHPWILMAEDDEVEFEGDDEGDLVSQRAQSADAFGQSAERTSVTPDM